MFYALIIISLLVIALVIKNLLQKQQIKSLIKQLQRSQAENNYQKVYYTSKDVHMEQLAWHINELIDHKKAIQADQIRQEHALKEAIASMSHDLRTPLTAINGYLQLLGQTPLSEKQRAQLMAATERADHLEKLINNFFALSIVESAEESFTLLPVNVNELIEEVAVSFYDQFQNKSIKPTFNLNDELVVLADETAAYRVIENIILNAIQHLTIADQREQTELQIDLVNEGKWAVLTVKNTFIDTTVDEVKVFNHFYTGDHSRKNKGGLGLAIVKRLMEKMAGDVRVQVTDETFIIVCNFKLA